MGRACSALDAFAARYGLALPVRRRLGTVLDDALANLVLHAVDPSARPIAVRVELDSAQIVLVLADHSAPFDPLLSARFPDPALPLDERPIGGLGVHLVKSLMSDVRYQRDGDRNLLTLTLRLTTTTPGSGAPP